MDVVFRCKCSRERVEQTLISLGQEELESMLAEEGKAEVVCHFCNEAYSFNASQLERLISKIKESG
jgi:molecular chaperone Hsp33